MIQIHCTSCGLEYPEGGMPHCCPVCGGLYDLTDLPAYTTSISSNFPGIWRYRSMLGLVDDGPVVTLGEGRTPLVEDGAFGLKIFNKLEYQNPTGSSHDRAAAVLINHMTRRGIQKIVLDTAGNAGMSVAAYAARAGIQTKVYAPSGTEEEKVRRVRNYGAEVTLLRGGRDQAEQAARTEADVDCAFASLAYQPTCLLGSATIAYELYEALGKAPATVVAPVGHGTLLLGIVHGFQTLLAAGMITALPRLIGVQARSSAPVWQRFRSPVSVAVPQGGAAFHDEKVAAPVYGDRLVSALRQTGGEMLVVEDAEIGPSRDQLARRGYYVEFTSAMVWAALRSAAETIEGPVALVLTGTAFKPGS